MKPEARPEQPARSRRPAHEAAAPRRARPPGPLGPPRLGAAIACLGRHPLAHRRPGPSPGRPPLLTCLSRCRRWRPSIPPFSSGRLRHGSQRRRLSRRPRKTSPDATTLSTPVVAAPSNWKRRCLRGGGTKNPRKLRPRPWRLRTPCRPGGSRALPATWAVNCCSARAQRRGFPLPPLGPRLLPLLTLLPRASQWCGSRQGPLSGLLDGFKPIAYPQSPAHLQVTAFPGRV